MSDDLFILEAYLKKGGGGGGALGYTNQTSN